MDVADKLVMVSVKQIKPYHRNVRKNDATVAKLVDIIPKVGFNVPLVLDRNNVIVKGHSRWKAALKLGMQKVPCVYSDADEETLKLDRLADNKVQEYSGWDTELLASELASLNLNFAFDIGTIGFKIDMPSFEVPAAHPQADYAVGGEEMTPADVPEQPFITDQDIQDTVRINPKEYLETACPKCGTFVFVRKS